MSRWFRLYDDTLNDPKILKLSDKTYRIWIGILCVASKNDGALPPFDDIALMLRMKPEKLQPELERLIAAGLIDHDDDGLRPHNWEGRQYKSDVSTERVKRFRNGKRNVSVTAPDTDTDTETETETEKKKDTRAVKDRTDADFEEFWKLKPSRGKAANPKAPAQKAYQAAVRKGADPKQINGAARRWALDELKPGTEYVAMAVTWLNQKRFDDYKPPPDDAALRARQDDLMRSRGFEWRDDKWAKIEGVIHEKVCG